MSDRTVHASYDGLARQLSWGEDDLELTMVFEHGGELYRVRRGYSARGRGRATLDFEKAVA